MPRTITVAIPLVVTVLATSCSGTTAHDSPTQPTQLATEASVSVSAASPLVAAQTAGPAASGCPAHAPFTVPVGVIVRANRDLRIFVTAITMRFTDSFNLQMPQITLAAPALTRQFGTNLVEARSARTFPLQVAIGCGTGKSGTVMMTVNTQDERGRQESAQVSVAVH